MPPSWVNRGLCAAWTNSDLYEIQALPLSLPLTLSTTAQLFIKIFLFILFHAVWGRLSPFHNISSHNGSGEDHGEEGLGFLCYIHTKRSRIGWRRTAKWLAKVIAFHGKLN